MAVPSQPQTNSLQDPISKNKQTKKTHHKKSVGGVTLAVKSPA
jgi:hypothetical protein